MPIDFGDFSRQCIDRSTVAEISSLPVAALSDELNRSRIMHAALRPLGCARFAGLALTVECMAGDNSPLHYALEMLQPGDVVVADARGHVETAVWGEVMHTCAKARGAVAVVIDGAIRDSTFISGSGLPAFVRGVCPRGPHNGRRGAINRTIQCAGVAVAPGDLVVGDEDGIIVVGPDEVGGLAERVRGRLAREAEVLRRVGAGELTVAVLGMPRGEFTGR